MLNSNWDPYDTIRNHEMRILGLERKINQLIDANNEQADFILELSKHQSTIAGLQETIASEIAQLKRIVNEVK